MNTDTLSAPAAARIDLMNAFAIPAASSGIYRSPNRGHGRQSAGKSSVLEAISGVPFPRGTGLVTRCAAIDHVESASRKRLDRECLRQAA